MGVVGKGSLVAGRVLNSVLDLIREALGASGVVTDGAGVVGAVPAGRVQ